MPAGENSLKEGSFPKKDLMTWWRKEHTRHLEKKHPWGKKADVAPGDKVRVHIRVQEGKRDRLQIFEGVCVQIGGNGLGRRIVVRKISHDEGVERTFPLWSPLLEEVELVSRGRVRRARLYYLRNLRGKATRIPVRTTGWVRRDSKK